MKTSIMTKTLLLLGVGTFLAANSHAQTWEGQAEAGIIKTSGNTESESINLGIDFSFYNEKWSNSLVADVYQSSNENIESANSVSADYVLERVLGNRSNAFISLGYLDDDFDGFTEKLSAAIGYGYKLIDSEKTQWDTAIGVGYRDTDVIVPPLDQDDGSSIPGSDLGINGGTFVARSDFTTSLTDNTKFIDSFKSEIGSDNSFYENEAALVVDMNERFALKVGFLLRHNTDPGPETEKTDTISTLSLIYKLGQ